MEELVLPLGETETSDEVIHDSTPVNERTYPINLCFSVDKRWDIEWIRQEMARAAAKCNHYKKKGHFRRDCPGQAVESLTFWGGKGDCWWPQNMGRGRSPQA